MWQINTFLIEVWNVLDFLCDYDKNIQFLFTGLTNIPIQCFNSLRITENALS